MLSTVAKLLLVATSLAPVLGAYGMIALSENKTGWQLWQWFVYAGLLVVICHLILTFSRTQLERHQIQVRAVRSTDDEVLAFLLAYLLPLIAHQTIELSGKHWTTVYVFVLIFITVYQSNAYHFNPLLGILFRYHFYEIESTNGISSLLITRKTIRQPDQITDVVHVSDYMFLDISE